MHGESAGGNIATVLALLARDEKLSPPLTGLSASVPAVLSKDAVPERFKGEYLSIEQNKDAPGLDAGGLDFVLCESWFFWRGREGGCVCVCVCVLISLGDSAL